MFPTHPTADGSLKARLKVRVSDDLLLQMRRTAGIANDIIRRRMPENEGVERGRGAQVYAAAQEDKEALQEQCGHWNVTQRWGGVWRRQRRYHKPSPRSVVRMFARSG
jgi:hypothetical protein